MRRVFLFVTFVLLVVVASATARTGFPETIALPNGFQPEGISIGKGTTFYVGSIPTGAVYRGNLRTGEGAILVPGATGRAAIGVEYARGLLFVAGGPTGKAFVERALRHSEPDDGELQRGANRSLSREPGAAPAAPGGNPTLLQAFV